MYICDSFDAAIADNTITRKRNTMKIKFISLASGSSGNCYFIGTDAYGILVDAGIGIRTIKKHLKRLGYWT